MDWKRLVLGIAAEAEKGVDRVRHGVDRVLGRERPVRIVPYRGYGNTDAVRVRGRVLHGAPPPPATPDDRWWANLKAAMLRLESDEVPGARVRVAFAGDEVEVRSDEEGHFVADLRPSEPLDTDRLWHEATVELLDAPGGLTGAPVAIPRASRFGVISDLDDTVLRTDARNTVRMVREVLFGNVHTRIPFPGVGAFYRALHAAPDGGHNPIFYVSSSPWNLYDLLAEFLRLPEVPAGPMQLRDWGLSGSELLPTGHRDHKRKAMDEIMDAYPDLPFILVGDSGQEDPEIYRDVIHDRPGQVLAVYIRSVVPEPMRIREVADLATEVAEAHAERENGPALVLVEDTMEAARHAADRGWLDAARLDDVGRQRAAES